MPTPQQEWAAFLALIPYFTFDPGPLKIRDRLMIFLQQCQEPILSRHTLLLQAGLSFFADEFEVDLALMQLIRNGVIRPVTDGPFTFALDGSPPKGAKPSVPSPASGGALTD